MDRWSRQVKSVGEKSRVGILNAFFGGIALATACAPPALAASSGRWACAYLSMEGKVITSPPLVVYGKVITGFAGGEYGVRGALQAYDANTGKTYLAHLYDTWPG